MSAAVDQAQENWEKAVDTLFTVDKQAKAKGVTDHEMLVGLSHVVSYLTAAVGALVLHEAGVTEL